MAAASDLGKIENPAELRSARDLESVLDWQRTFSRSVMTDHGMDRTFNVVRAVAFAETSQRHYSERSIRILKTLILGKAVAEGAWKIVNKCLNEWHINPKDVSEIAHMLPIVIILVLRGKEENVERWLEKFCNAETISQLGYDGKNALHIAAIENVPVRYTNYLIKNYPGLADQPNTLNGFKPIHYAHGDNLAALCKLPGVSVHINEVRSGKTLLHWRICSVRCLREAGTMLSLEDILILLKAPGTDVWKTARSPEGVELTPMQFLERNFQGARLSSKVNAKLNEVKALLQAKMDATKPREPRGSDTSNVTTTSTATGASGGAIATAFRAPDNPRGSDEVATTGCSCSIM